ncbi:hypothetical protein ANN_02887 [Periplaneta americana]|uniref:Uncharacterized protein n=1 Tax=Periplaneta americana TaxID=6978 RepID=A0ABQ8U257_PERAM|nr:hypothetical protein ANN_02887 [Periplaneta americana]
MLMTTGSVCDKIRTGQDQHSRLRTYLLVNTGPQTPFPDNRLSRCAVTAILKKELSLKSWKPHYFQLFSLMTAKEEWNLRNILCSKKTNNLSYLTTLNGVIKQCFAPVALLIDKITLLTGHLFRMKLLRLNTRIVTSRSPDCNSTGGSVMCITVVCRPIAAWLRKCGDDEEFDDLITTIMDEIKEGNIDYGVDDDGYLANDDYENSDYDDDCNGDGDEYVENDYEGNNDYECNDENNYDDIEKRDDKLNLFEYYLQLTLIITVTEHNLLRQYWISSLRDVSLFIFRLHIRE